MAHTRIQKSVVLSSAFVARALRLILLLVPSFPVSPAHSFLSPLTQPALLQYCCVGISRSITTKNTSRGMPAFFGPPSIPGTNATTVRSGLLSSSSSSSFWPPANCIRVTCVRVVLVPPGLACRRGPRCCWQRRRRDGGPSRGEIPSRRLGLLREGRLCVA